MLWIPLKQSTLSSGIFVNETNNLPSNLSELYNSIITRSLPLSWFIAEHFLPKQLHEYVNFKSRIVYGQPTIYHSSSEYKGEEWLHGIVSGNTKAISQLIEKIEDRSDKPKNFSFLPAHTINIEITSEREHPIVEKYKEDIEEIPF
ncbi:MAG: hypothetical protein HEQ33_09465 [Dolichospermum sp. WA123]|nr:hypothetical protein [Dolichospermum sp. WA123]